MSPEQRIKILEEKVEHLLAERQDIDNKVYLGKNLVVTDSIQFGDGIGPKILWGQNTPSNLGIDAPDGSLYLRTNGTSSTTLYVKHAPGAANWSDLT